MKIHRLSLAMVALVLAGCAQNAKTIAPPPQPPVTAQTPAPPPVQTVPPIDTAEITSTERDLRALGYPVGKSDELNDTALRHAIVAFEKDQGLAEDGRLSPALEERLKQLRSVMPGKNTTLSKGRAQFVYSDGTLRSTGLGMFAPLPSGYISDAPPDFPRTMRPGSEADYRLGHRTPGGGFVAKSSISCHAGHLIRSNTRFGVADLLAVDCQVEGDTGHAWHALFSPMLDTVLQQDGAGKNRILVAIRPSTAGWPPAARTGLDWAITHALESPAFDTAVQWSSTGVARHFEVRAFGKSSGRELGLKGKYAGLGCRRFELAETDHAPSLYPGIACQNATGSWALAGTAIALSSPAKTVKLGAASPDPKSALNP